MDAADSRSQRERQLPDLDTLDVQSLKALVLAKQAELDSRTTEIENLKLLILKLKRMQFGPRSEKYDRDIQQLELRLEDLEANQAAAEPPPIVPATIALKQQGSAQAGAPSACRLSCRAKRRRSRPSRKRARIAAARCASWARSVGDAGIRSGAIQSDPHGAAEAELRGLLADRAGAGAEPADRSRSGRAGLLAHVLVAKYADHLAAVPASRRSIEREGVELDRSTLADWVGGASRTLQPLVDALKKYVLGAEKLHGDDVPVPVLEPGNGKTKTGRLWTYVRDDRPAGSRSAGGGVVRLLAGSQGRASGGALTELQWHPAGRWLCGIQQAL